MVRLGVSGHRSREGADWDWVRAQMTVVIRDVRNLVGFSSLAPGADQIFADEILRAGGRLVAVIPAHRQIADVDGPEGLEFGRLKALAKRRIRVGGASPSDAHWRAGKLIVDRVEFMVFAWDGAPSRGLGGTADIVAYAQRKGRKSLILDPIRRTLR